MEFKTEMIIMLKNNLNCHTNSLGIFVILSLISVNSLMVEPSFAQTSSPIEEDVSITGDSLQGLDSSSLAGNQSNTPKWDVTVEREKKQPSFSTGNEFFDSLLQKQSEPTKTSTEEKINTNKGDVPVNQGGTIPLFNF